MTLEIAIAFGVIIAAFVLFVLDKYPVDFTAFAIMATILVLGPVLDVKPEEAISGFSSPATITVLAVFILSGGIQRSGAINILARHMIRIAGDNPVRQQLTVQGVLAPISPFINNTAAVAIMIPAVMKLAAETRQSPSKLLIPLSYMAQLTGVVTLIGTSTNIIASQLLEESGHAPFSMFEFAHVGILVTATGAIYLIFIGRRLLPDHQVGNVTGVPYGVADYLTEFIILEDSPLVGKTLAESGLSTDYDVQVLEIRRGETRIRHRLARRKLQVGDILQIWASTENLLRLKEAEGIAIEAENRLEGEVSSKMRENMEFMEVVIGPNSDLIGSTVASSNFRNRYGVTVIAIRKQGELLRERLGHVRLGFGDTLLMQGDAQSFDLIRRNPGFIVTEQPNIESFRTRKIPIAIGIVAGVVIVAALGQPILVTSIVGCVMMVLTGCLRVDELHESIRWDVILLLAGMIPLGIMLERTGGAQLLADQAVRLAEYVPPIGVLYIFYIVTSLMTEVVSNNATAVIMVPIGVSSATSLGVDPSAIVLAIMFAASTSFATPMSYQTNTMVYGIGGYTFRDFLRVGGPLNLIMMATTPLWIYLFWGI